MNEQELLDLVDKDDNIIGTIDRADYDRLISDELGYIRAVEMFIVNSKGELWIPKRTADKTIAPNGFDYSAAGHVTSGETYIEAMLKETEEEVNIKLSEDDIEYVGTIGPDQNRYIRKLYIYRSDETPEYNPADFVSASWLTPEQIFELLDSGVPAKSTLRDAVEFAAGWLAVHH